MNFFTKSLFIISILFLGCEEEKIVTVEKKVYVPGTPGSGNSGSEGQPKKGPGYSDQIGDEYNNGAGSVENLVLNLYEDMPFYLENCLGPDGTTNANKDFCHLDAVERKMLEQVKENVEKDIEYVNNSNKPRTETEVGQVQRFFFVSGSEVEKDKGKNPFLIDGSIKIAKTGYKKYSPIYFNMDYIYRKDSYISSPGFNGFQTIKISRLLALLVHELIHHTGIKGHEDHERLDITGRKVGDQMESKTNEENFVQGNFSPKAVLIRVNQRRHKRVWILIEKEMADLTEELNIPEELCTRYDPAFVPNRTYNILKATWNYSKSRSINDNLFSLDVHIFADCNRRIGGSKIHQILGKINVNIQFTDDAKIEVKIKQITAEPWITGQP